MKIIKVEYYNYNSEQIPFHSEDCPCNKCNNEGSITLGYFSEDYDIESVILKLMNHLQNWDKTNIKITKINLNKIRIDNETV